MDLRSTAAPFGVALSIGLALPWPGLSLADSDSDSDSRSSSASCTISPQNPTVTPGGSVAWSANVSGFSRTPNYNWSFNGGNPSSSTSQTRTVSYPQAGTFATTLQVSRRGTQATCTTQVTVRSSDTAPPGGGTPPNASINSTSQNTLDVGVDPYTVGPVDEAPKPDSANSLSPAAGTGSSGYQVVAINDLGMHCGDLDTRISSILPPFQVLLAQVIQKGAEPKVLGPSQAQVTYSAASNPNDPILSAPLDPATNYPFTGLTDSGDVYKTNFWTVAFQAYDPFYPPGILTAFYDPNDPSKNVDLSLPVPNVEDLYIGPDGLVNSGDEFLSAVQHAMPGIGNPYVGNDAEVAEEHYGDKPFFVNFPFGYVANGVNWFEGAGVPFAAFDDFGRENPYPLVRVQAKNSSGTTVLATVDTVLPISGEASCKNCHGSRFDMPDSPNAGSANQTLIDAGLPVEDSTSDPLVGASVPLAVSVEYATDINVLRLHDLLHGAAYRDTDGNATACNGMSTDTPNGNANCLANQALDQGRSVVCQVCHYTPALDLAQFGPLGGDAANPDTAANGRVQRVQQSNSRVLHMAHAGTGLFPAMPAPTADSADTGLPGNQAAREAVLEQTCYQCHPGTNTKCMRGAMANGGMVCQDCHGDLTQVGDDFTANVSAAQPFPAGADLTKRVPWANEPGCGSCHTGDANNNLAGSTGTAVNGYDTNGNADGIRLIRAYLSGDTNAKPIVPANKRFAENTVPASFNGFANPGAGNQKLYRVSTGHGGVMCEGCHGATHAEWDQDGSPLKNDNVTSGQLQGHSGTVSECSACHTTSAMSSDTQGGPHGMHLVNDSRFWKEAHKDLAKRENGKAGGGTCGSCHGSDHLGTVLSRSPVTRSFSVEGSNRTVQAGDPVSCGLCHSVNKSFER